MNFDIILLVKELKDLVNYTLPIINEFRSHNFNYRLILVLTPSNEKLDNLLNFASKLEGVAGISNPYETINYLFKGKNFTSFPLNKQGAILAFNGTESYAIMLSNKLKYPIFLYTDKYSFWAKWIYKIFLTNEYIYSKYRIKKIDPYRLSIIGDVQVDIIKNKLSPLEIRKQLNLSQNSPILSIIPDEENRSILPLKFKVAEQIKTMYPNLQIALILTPFFNLKNLSNIFNHNFISENTPFYLKLNDTLINVIPMKEHYNAYLITDLAITSSFNISKSLTITGTPMIFIKKESQIKNYNILDKLKNLLNKNRTKLLFNAYPNIKTQNFIVPEYHILNTKDIIENSINILQDPLLRREIVIKLKEISPKNSGTQKLVDIIKDELSVIYSSYNKNIQLQG